MLVLEFGQFSVTSKVVRIVLLLYLLLHGRTLPRLGGLLLPRLGLRSLYSLELRLQSIHQFAGLRVLIPLLQFLYVRSSNIDVLAVVLSEAVELNAELVQVIIVHENDLLLLIPVQQRVLRVYHLLVGRVEHVLDLQVQNSGQDREDVASLDLGDLLLVHLGQDGPEQGHFRKAGDELDVVLQIQLGLLDHSEIN